MCLSHVSRSVIPREVGRSTASDLEVFRIESIVNDELIPEDFYGVNVRLDNGWLVASFGFTDGELAKITTEISYGRGATPSIDDAVVRQLLQLVNREVPHYRLSPPVASQIQAYAQSLAEAYGQLVDIDFAETRPRQCLAQMDSNIGAAREKQSVRR